AAGRTEQGEEFAPTELQRQVIDGGEGVEAFGDVAQDDARRLWGRGAVGLDRGGGVGSGHFSSAGTTSTGLSVKCKSLLVVEPRMIPLSADSPKLPTTISRASRASATSISASTPRLATSSSAIWTPQPDAWRRALLSTLSPSSSIASSWSAISPPQIPGGA